MSLDDLYNHLKVYESEVQKKSKSNSENMAFISSAKNSSGKEDVNTASTNVSPASVNIREISISQDTTYAYIASQSSGSQIKFKEITQIDEDDMEEMNIKWNMTLLSMRADRFWKKTGKKIFIHGTDVAGAPRSQDRGRRDNYRQGSKVEEQSLKALMAIDGVGWDWSFMANEEEDHALVADEETPTEFALIAKTSADSEVFDNSLCSKTCLSQVKSRLVEFKNQEVKYCEKKRSLEFMVEARANRIECLTNELELLKKENEGLESKLTGFQSASKDLDSLLESQRSDKNKEGLGYNADLSWTELPEFADDTITDYSRASPAIESTSDDV
nr:hypothetical protein [Tanacetum cinerariifolium]